MILRTISIQTKNMADGETASITTTLESDDLNGQLFVRVVAAVGDETIERRHSIGAADGNDSLEGLSMQDVAASIQPDVDAVRATVLKIATTRANVRTAGAHLT